jgi:hypothetical protein
MCGTAQKAGLLERKSHYRTPHAGFGSSCRRSNKQLPPSAKSAAAPGPAGERQAGPPAAPELIAAARADPRVTQAPAHDSARAGGHRRSPAARGRRPGRGGLAIELAHPLRYDGRSTSAANGAGRTALVRWRRSGGIQHLQAAGLPLKIVVNQGLTNVIDL